MNAFIAPDLLSGPPGLVHPLLVDKYAWVDARLEEMCSVVEVNVDNYQNIKILTENEDWLESWLSMDEKINQTTTILQRMSFRDVR